MRDKADSRKAMGTMQVWTRQSWRYYHSVAMCLSWQHIIFLAGLMELGMWFNSEGSNASEGRYELHVGWWQEVVGSNYSFFYKRFYLFLERGEGGRRRGREKSMCGCFSHAPYWKPDLQPRHVPWLGVEPATLWFRGQHSIHWATPARANIILNIRWLPNIYSQGVSNVRKVYSWYC